MRYLAQILITLVMITGSAYSTAQCGGPVPQLCDTDGSFDVDSKDIAAIGGAKGSPSSGPGDLRDVDGDGMITVNDARKCVQSCTLPNCATTPNTPNVSLNLHKVGFSTGVLSVKTPLSEEQVCGVDCDDLTVEVPQGTPVTLEAQTSAGTILWSWGGLPCDQLSNSCQFVLEEDIERNISFEYAELDSSTFAVLANEASEYEDPTSGVRVIISAGATLRDTNLRLLIATNERGERLFSVEILEPEDWVQGLHSITIDMMALFVDVQPQYARVQALGAAEQTLSTEIHPRQPHVPFLQFYPSALGQPAPLTEFVENRLFPVEGLTCPVVFELLEGTPKFATHCSYKDHALTVARCTCDQEEGAAGVCSESAWPVILINGYQAKDGTDDPDLNTTAAEYWNDLPYALHTDGYAPYTFRWKSAQRYQDAAASLRQAVDDVRARHQGKAPVLVAHSFGGLVARMYAQGADSSPVASAPSESEVRGVITIGAPHSGIAPESVIEGNLYPSGADTYVTGALIGRCRQISCYQAGRNEDYFPELGLGEQQDFRNLYGIYFPGETIHRLSYPAPGQEGMRVPLKVLIGLKEYSNGGESPWFGGGDGLISWQGQRVHPELSCSNQACETRAIGDTADFFNNNTRVFGNSVTEILLGALHIQNQETLVPEPGTTSPEGFRSYAHSSSTNGFLSSIWTQTGIKRDEHVDVVPRQHDVLLAVLETLEEWTGGNPPPPATFPLNDTGITFGGNYRSGNNTGCTGVTIAQQDCSHGRDVTHNDDSDGYAGFSYTKLSSNGTALPASATSWACVRDNVTGLVWEMKTDDGGIHDKDNTYRWGGKTAQGTGYGTYYPDWDVLVDGSNNDALCGFSAGWRVPTLVELQSLVNYNSIDTAWFPNTVLSFPWSASPSAPYSNHAWFVGFGPRYPGGQSSRDFNLPVRVVHVGQ